MATPIPRSCSRHALDGTGEGFEGGAAVAELWLYRGNQRNQGAARAHHCCHIGEARATYTQSTAARVQSHRVARAAQALRPGASSGRNGVSGERRAAARVPTRPEKTVARAGEFRKPPQDRSLLFAAARHRQSTLGQQRPAPWRMTPPRVACQTLSSTQVRWRQSHTLMWVGK